MDNKVLIKLIVPELNSSYDIFIPVNELIWKTKKLLIKAVSDLSDGALVINREYLLMNKSTGRIYKNNENIHDTEIRNSTELVLLSLGDNNYNSALRQNITLIK